MRPRLVQVLRRNATVVVRALVLCIVLQGWAVASMATCPGHGGAAESPVVAAHGVDCPGHVADAAPADDGAGGHTSHQHGCAACFAGGVTSASLTLAAPARTVSAVLPDHPQRAAPALAPARLDRPPRAASA
jgi:hypothetical protein